MKHLEIMKLLTALTEAKKILNNIQEYDDFDMIELLEIKYEKMYRITFARDTDV
jgi:hypothetical protein